MTKSFRYEVDFNAPAEAVWAIIVDIARWHTWNSYATFEEGEVKVGAKATLRFALDGDGKWQTTAVELREVDADKLILRWGGGLGPIVQANHWLRLERRGSGSCRLYHGEDITGLLPALNLGMPYAKLDRMYKLVNDAMKAKAEGKK